MKRKIKSCPRCSKNYSDYPAISRRDNKTEICTNCGVEEAIIDCCDVTNIPYTKFKREMNFCNSLGLKCFVKVEKEVIKCVYMKN